ncbi:hypothetical protein MD484_g8779, partial [Candolleomyces efflorescens]
MASSSPPLKRESESPLRYLPIDAFIGHDADIVFGPPIFFEQVEPALNPPQPPPPAPLTLWKGWKRIIHGILTFLLVVTNMWNITLALSDIARFGCSHYYGVSVFEDLPRICQPIIPPYQKWPAFKSLEAQVSRHTQQVYGLSSMLRKLDDVLGVALGADRDLARAPQAAIISPLTTSRSGSPFTGWMASLSNSLSSPPSVVYLPDVVLDSPPNTGECWQFSGDRGHVAIRLAHHAVVTAFSVALPPFAELWDEKYQAPRSIHAWGHPVVPLFSVCSDFLPQRSVSDFKTARLPASVDSKGQLISLGKFEYNITAPYARQMFPLEPNPLCEIPVLDFVVVEILANWGADKTCIYHVGVHGTRP